MRTITVPTPFALPPFYNTGETLSIGDDHLSQDHPPFYFDIWYQLENDAEVKWPWLEEEGSDFCLTLWEKSAPQIEALFRDRQPKQAAPLMIQLIEAFICLLFWSEHRPVTFEKGLSGFNKRQVAPVNLEERLSFLCESPGHYHAFVQLTALFEELKKKRALYKLRQKG